MSPEQALGKKVDRRADVFCLGIVLWEALTGKDLFKGSTPIEVLASVREQKILPPSKVVPDLTPIVDPIVMRALRRAPNQRYQTAGQMRDDIEALMKRAGVEIGTEVISKEVRTIYGEEIRKRAHVLRRLREGENCLEEVAEVLGAGLLNRSQLPSFSAGQTDPDPLRLFSSGEGLQESIDIAIPREDRREPGTS